MPPPWDLCLFAPDPPPALAFVTPGQKVRPQTRHRQAPIGGGLSYRPVMPADFKAETYVETPRNGRFPGFRGSGPTFWGSRARNPGIRGPGPGIGGLDPGNLGPDGQETGIRGQKNPELGPPSPELSDPRTQEPGTEKKVDPTPKKKSSPKKKRPGHITNPPPAYNNRSQLRVKRKYRSDSQ